MAAELKIKITAQTDQAAKEIKDFTKEVKGTTSAMPQLTRNVGSANTALVNFGRVVQDAPFGLIGIANNIDPLITSFQQLKAQSGSTGGALKALFSSLAGPAGIAIGVSAVTSALIAFGPEIKEFFGSVDIAAERAKSAAKAFEDSSKSVADEAANVRSLISVLNDEGKSRENKIAALKELNRISPEYFNGLEIEGNTVKGLPQAYDSYIKSLLDVARAKAATTQISELYEKRLQLESKLIGEDLASALSKSADATAQLNKQRGTVVQLSIGPVLTKEEQAALALNNSIAELDRQINELALKTGPQFRKESAEKIKQIKAETQAVKELREASRPVITNQNPALVTPLPRQAPPALTDFPQTLDELERANNVITDLGQTAFGQFLNPAIADAAKEAQQVNAAFSLFSPLVEQGFNALANGQNVLDSLIQGVKRLIVQLALAAAQAAILSALSGGTTTFGKSFLKLLGFANGGIAFGPTPALVGEAGPEAMLRLTDIPNLLRGGGMASNQRVDGFIRGNSIYISNKRGSSSYARLFG